MIKTTVKVDGMMCGMCESHVNDAVRKAFQVDKVSSSHSKGETTLITDAPVDEARLKAAINATGYEVKGITSEPFEKKKRLFSFLHKSIGNCLINQAVTPIQNRTWILIVSRFFVRFFVTIRVNQTMSCVKSIQNMCHKIRKHCAKSR